MTLNTPRPTDKQFIIKLNANTEHTETFLTIRKKKMKFNSYSFTREWKEIFLSIWPVPGGWPNRSLLDNNDGGDTFMKM